MKPLISVIIPVYNASNYLHSCVQSLLNQTFKDFEIILINDGSKDNSLEICNLFKQKDERVVVFTQPNSGVGRARNKGIELAKGKYIVFVDSDDVAKPTLLEKLSENIRDFDYVLASIDLVRNGQIESIVSIPEGEFTRKQYVEQILLKLNINYVCGAPYSKLFKTELIKQNNLKFNEKLTYAEDFLFNVEYVALAQKIKTISDSFYEYTLQSSSSLTSFNYQKSSFDTFLESRLLVFNRFEEIVSKITDDRKDEISSLLLAFVLDSANYACVKQNRKDAMCSLTLLRKNKEFLEHLTYFKPSSKKEALKFRLLKNNHRLIYYLLASLKGRKK